MSVPLDATLPSEAELAEAHAAAEMTAKLASDLLARAARARGYGDDDLWSEAIAAKTMADATAEALRKLEERARVVSARQNSVTRTLRFRS